MAEQLSPLDATFLELEEANWGAHMHIGAVLVFEPRPDGRAPSDADVSQQLEERIDELPRFRQRLSSPTTGGLSWPAWQRSGAKPSVCGASCSGCLPHVVESPRPCLPPPTIPVRRERAISLSMSSSSAERCSRISPSVRCSISRSQPIRL
jgi:Wax ester synthase/diacylglycerol acyltransferase catalytic domain